MGQGGDREQRPGLGELGDTGAVQQTGPDAQVDHLRIGALKRRRQLEAVRDADAWNKAHPDWVRKFNELTGGACANADGGADAMRVRFWQGEHHVETDGKVGAKTLEAADRGAGGKRSGVVSFTDEEAGTLTVRAPRLGRAPNGDLAERVVAGGETGGAESRQPADPGEALAEGGGWVKEGGEKTVEATGAAEGDGPRAEGAHGVVVRAGLSVAVRLALVPQIVHLLREHKIGQALNVVWKSVAGEERAELVKYVAEQVGGELSGPALEIFERAALVGAVADVLMLAWEWTYGGLKAIAEAHEKGDRDSRIGIYAYAWSDTVMTGHHSNPGAVFPEQIEAMRLGIENGRATRELSPDLPSLLLAQYGDEGNARHALEDALLKRAGITGITTHHG